MTARLQSALKEVNTQIKNTQSQLKDVEKFLRLDPSNTELLAQKQRFLTDAIPVTGMAVLHQQFLLVQAIEEWIAALKNAGGINGGK